MAGKRELTEAALAAANAAAERRANGNKPAPKTAKAVLTRSPLGDTRSQPRTTSRWSMAAARSTHTATCAPVRTRNTLAA